jgi:tetratricopeptide (TPR) repeat protein
VGILDKILGRGKRRKLPEEGGKLLDAGWTREELREAARDVVAMARALFENHRLNDAETLVMRAKVFYEEAGDRDGVGTCYRYEGSICRERGDLQGAQMAFGKSLSLAHSAKDHARMSLCESGIGGVLEKQGDSAGAMAAYRRAIDLAKQGGDFAHASICHGLIADLLGRQENYVEAQHHYREGAKTAAQANSAAVMAECLQGLAEMYVRTGDDARALEALKAYEEAVRAVGEPVDPKALTLMEVLRQKVGS